MVNFIKSILDFVSTEMSYNLELILRLYLNACICMYPLTFYLNLLYFDQYVPEKKTWDFIRVADPDRCDFEGRIRLFLIDGHIPDPFFT